LSHVFALFNTTSASTANACYIHYDSSTNLVYLADNAGASWLGGFAPSGSGSIGNSQCAIAGTNSSPNPTSSGTQLGLTLNVTFQSSFAGTKNEYLYALDGSGVTTGWQQMGTWTIPAPPVPDFTLTTAQDTNYVQLGVLSTISYPLTVTPQNGFNSPVSFSMSVYMYGCAYPAFNPAVVTGQPWTTTLTMQCNETLQSGYWAKVQASGGGKTHEIFLYLWVGQSQQYFLTTGVSPAGGGSINPASGWYNSGTQVMVTASANTGYQFTGFSGSLAGVSPGYVIMNSNKSVTANFTQTVTSYSLTTMVSPSGGGTVSPSCPGECSYSSGTQVTLTATPATGYQFTGWTGTVNSTSNPLTLTMNSAKTETANFTSTLTVPATMVSPTPGSALPSHDATFQWNWGSGVSACTLSIGSTPGSSDYFSETYDNTGLQTESEVVNSLPWDGRTVFVTLSSNIGSQWVVRSYTYAARLGTLSAQPQAAPSGWYVLNDSQTYTWTALITITFSDGWFYYGDAQYVTSCSTSASGVTLTLPSGQSGPIILQATASYSAPSGTGTVTCGYHDPYSLSNIANGFTIYDATPQITSLQQNAPNPDGSFYVEIYGHNFGTAGSLGICSTGAPSCNGTPDLAVIPNAPYSSWSSTQVNALLAPSPSASGNIYDIQVVSSSGVGGRSFAPAPQGQSSSGSNRKQVTIRPPSVTITSRPITITPSTLPGQYTAVLTSTSSPPGGVYTWTSNNPSMVGFDSSTPAIGPSADHVKLVIIGTNDKTTITLTYAGPLGGQASDSFTFALTNDTVAVAWVDAKRVVPDKSQLPLGDLDPIYDALNSDPVSCGLTLLQWATLGQNGQGGINNNGLTDPERIYANQFLIANTGNAPPPDGMSVDDTAYTNGFDYRMYQRLQASYEVSGSGSNPTFNASSLHFVRRTPPMVGGTPIPCPGMAWIHPPVESHPINGTSGLTTDNSLVVQVNQSRLGLDGQALNQFLNGHPGGDYTTVTPWIWSVIQFDANGKTRSWTQSDLDATKNNLQIFPSYRIYTNGTAVCPGSLCPIFQGDLTTFIGLDSTSQYRGPK
jgi:uncharacterized repeat protein (TIGR02543 family)